MMTYEKLGLKHLESEGAFYCGNGSAAALAGGGYAYGCGDGGNLAQSIHQACTDGARNTLGTLGSKIYWCANGPTVMTDCELHGATIDAQVQVMLTACKLGGGLD